MSLIFLIERLERKWLAYRPEEIAVNGKEVVIVVGGRHYLDILLPSCLLCCIEGNAHEACGEWVEIMALGVSAFREDQERVARVDTLGNEVERLIVLLNRITAVEVASEGRDEAESIEQLGEILVQIEHIGSCHHGDGIAERQSKDDIDRVVGSVLVVADDEIARTLGRQVIKSDSISLANHHRFVDKSDIADESVDSKGA